jgi:hypothetical protein
MNLIRRYLRWLDMQHALVQFFSLWTVLVCLGALVVAVIVVLDRLVS